MEAKFHENSSVEKPVDMRSVRRNKITRLVRGIEAEEAIDACKCFLGDDAALNTAFLSNGVEEFLKCPFKCKNLLNVGTLRYEGLDHSYGLCHAYQ